MNFNWDLLMALTAAHLLADFIFQPDKDATSQRQRMAMLGKSAVIVAGLSYLLAGDWQAWAMTSVIGLTHYVIDWVKSLWKRNDLNSFALDQTAHLLVILGLSWHYPMQSHWLGLWGITFTRALVILAGIILTVWVGGAVVGMTVKTYLDDLVKTKTEKKAASSPSANPDKYIAERGLLKGGKTIGQLERGLIFFLVMIGKPEAVAFLIAAKSVFRFGELTSRKSRAEAEYITIGTLMSFTWGLVVAWVTWWLYGKLS
jgi:prepilin signal peptidase PulO-like enzyme (type II secretory pathway)